jgi:hypothetical protein
MKRLRLRVNPKDRAFVEAQGSTKRKFKPFAHAFGSKSESNAALIVQAVNCHELLVKTVLTIQREASRPVNGNGSRMRTRLALIARHAGVAVSRVQS